MLNSVCLMGRLTRDPELRTTGKGTSVASFCVAVDRDTASNGNRECDFIDCVAWGKTADFVSRYFTKGKMIAIDGRLSTRTWEDKDGKKRKNMEVTANSVYFCGDKSGSSAAPACNPGSYNPAGWSPDPAPAPDFQLIETDEQLPF